MPEDCEEYFADKTFRGTCQWRRIFATLSGNVWQVQFIIFQYSLYNNTEYNRTKQISSFSISNSNILYSVHLYLTELRYILCFTVIALTNKMFMMFPMLHQHMANKCFKQKIARSNQQWQMKTFCLGYFWN